VGRVLAFGGRHSLLVYLVHQPVFFGLLSLAVAMGAPKADLATPPGQFAAACTRTCSATGTDAGYCQRMCGCVGDRLAGSPLLTRSMQGAVTPDDEAVLRGHADVCRKAISADGDAE
jgi:uncharacterized membrane protein